MLIAQSVAVGLVFGCGSDSVVPRPRDLQVDPGSVRVGERAAVVVAFTPEVGSAIDPATGEERPFTRNATAVIRIPEGLDYVAGSTETDTAHFHGFESRNPNTVQLCPDNAGSSRSRSRAGNSRRRSRTGFGSMWRPTGTPGTYRSKP
jgi:hypothetical protein